MIAVGCGRELSNGKVCFGCFLLGDKIKIEKIIQYQLFLLILGRQCWVRDITRCHILPPPIRISKDKRLVEFRLSRDSLTAVG